MISAPTLTIWNNLETAEVNSSPSLENYLHLESESAILMEAQSGQILFEKEPHKKLRPASVTKVMSLLLIMEALDRGDITLETEISCSENASDFTTKFKTTKTIQIVMKIIKNILFFIFPP